MKARRLRYDIETKLTPEEGEEAIKAYGRQCAEQALKDAAENAEIILVNYDMDPDIITNKILSTQIITK